jgi:large subunit ribosomal protein L25
MKSIVIKAQKREELGKKGSKKLRKDEFVPGVIYGGEKPIHFYVDFKDFRQVIYTPNVYLINIDLEGQVIPTIIKDMQWHPVEEQLLHLDLLQVKEDKPIKVELPVKTVGMAIGIKQGGKLKLNMRKLKVKAFAKDFPDLIEINVENLQVGQCIKVSDLKFENLEFLDLKTNVIVAVEVTRAVKTGEDVVAEPGAESAEPAKTEKE